MFNDQKSHWLLFRRLNPFKSNSAEKTDARRANGWRLSRRRIVFWGFAFLSTIGAGLCVRAEIHRRVSRLADYSQTSVVHKGGTLLIAGGGQLSNMIRHRFVELAGGKQARIVVIPATSVDETTIAQYRASWIALDVESVEILHADSRTEADDPEFSKILDTATGVWLGGGQQTWLAAWYGRTRVETRLKELLARNGVIGGTSAGAAVMSSVMIAGGRERPTMGHGFDLIPGAIIDQHFVKRNRIRRLQSALEQHPDLVGFGIDEGTALQYAVESGRFQVVGHSCVVACVPQVEPGQQPNFRIEFFNPGDEFDIQRLRHGDAVPLSYVDLDSILLGE